jgi:hypothetical protein
MPAGRPTDYGPKIVKKAQKYLDSEWKKDELTPTIEGLSVYLGISRETIYAWHRDNEKEEFSDIVKQIMSTQGKTLIKGGLNKDFSPQIAALMLAKHGYKNEVDVTSGNKPIPLLNALHDNNSDKKDSETEEKN